MTMHTSSLFRVKHQQPYYTIMCYTNHLHEHTFIHAVRLHVTKQRTTLLAPCIRLGTSLPHMLQRFLSSQLVDDLEAFKNMVTIGT